MKFSQLPVGASFEYEGERYTKSGPMVASGETSGQQRFLPRYANVKPLSDVAVEEPTGPVSGTIELEAVAGAVDAYHGRCREILDRLESALDRALLDDARAQLESARRRFMDALKS